MKHILVVGLIAMLAIAACGDGGETRGPATGAGDETPTAETGGDIAVETGGDDVRSDLDSIFSKAGNLEFKVTYDMESEFDGETTEGQLSMYLKGEKIRTDMTSPEGEVRSYILEESFVTCMNDGGWQCFSFEQPQDEQAAPDVQETYEADEEQFWNDYSVTRLPDRTIAGTTAKCFRMDEKAQGMSWDACYSREGVPLYMKTTTPEGTATQEATSYSTSVANSEFVPPAEPQDFGDMMGQYGGGDFDPSQYQ